MFGTLDFATLVTNASTITADFVVPITVIASMFVASKLLRIVKGFLR